MNEKTMSQTKESDACVLIVGAGLAGLSCAVHLNQAGIPIRIFEASDGVGGRVRTDVVDGYRLDRGFQVYLNAYPEAGELLDLEALDLRPFEPGALVYRSGKLHRLMDVFRRPAALIPSLTAPVGGLLDKLRVGLLRMKLLRSSLEAIERREAKSTEAYLKDFGFSDAIVDRFFRSFYGGIFLERSLQTSSRMFEFTFKMFGLGSATIPAKGMGAIPDQLAARLQEGAVQLNSLVEAVDRNSVRLKDGQQIHGAAVVVATNAAHLGMLLPELPIHQPSWRSVMNVYFAADRSPINEAIICLNGEGRGYVNSVCVLSDAAPDYAPPEKALLSVAVLGMHSADGLVDSVRSELVQWFGPEVNEWQHLRTDQIREALPEQLPDRPTCDAGYLKSEGVWVCGDHVTTASIEGAVISGKRLASALLMEIV